MLNYLEASLKKNRQVLQQDLISLERLYEAGAQLGSEVRLEIIKSEFDYWYGKMNDLIHGEKEKE